MNKKHTLSQQIKSVMGMWCNHGCDDPDYAMEQMEALFQKVVEKAIPQKEECYIDFNPKKHFIENLANSNKIARNDLICKIRASFKDILEGKIEI